MPLDTLITGRIATLAGEVGFGWVEAIGVRDGRVAFAGTEVDLETRADPHTERIALEPDQVAIPGLTDAHLHLAQCAVATRQVDLADALTLDDGLERIGAAHQRQSDPDAWLEGYGWDSDRWGGWPSAGDLERVAPGRRCAIWAHDHHALWVSRAALAHGWVDRETPDPSGGVIGRDPDGHPDGILFEEAAGLVAVHLPSMPVAELERALVTCRTRVAVLRDRRRPRSRHTRPGSGPELVVRGLPSARRDRPTAGSRSRFDPRGRTGTRDRSQTAEWRDAR